MIPCCTINLGPRNQPDGFPIQPDGLRPLPMAPNIGAGPQLFGAPHALLALPAEGQNSAEQTRKQPVETKSSSDHVLPLLNKILEEHASLRGLVQQQHQALSQRLEEMSVSLPSGQMQPQGPRGQQGNTAPVPTPAPEVLAKAQHSAQLHQTTENAKMLGKSDKHVASGQSSWQREKDKKKEQEKLQDKLEMAERNRPKSLVEQIISSPQFDVMMGTVILANTCVMFAGIQMKGLDEGFKLGVREEDPQWAMHEARFDLIEDIFNGVYLLELLVRIAVHGQSFFKQYSNVMDAMIVVFSCLDSFVLQKLAVKTVNISVLRLARLTRLIRVAKFLRGAAMFAELRILIATLTVAMRGIIWSVVLLAAMVVAGGILMAQLAFNFLESDSITYERRIWLYQNFGTTMSAIYTMFECTFTGGWRLAARPLIEEVHYLFAVFWVTWIILVNFMTMRVVGALFLKSTLAIAAQSDERLAMQAQKKKKETAAKIEELFKAADETGDGCLGLEEFEAMLEKQEVVDAFDEMGLDTDELFALFSVLAYDDGGADYEEFMTGALAMTSSSPQLDNMKNSQNQLKLAGDMHLVLDQTIAIRKVLGSLSG